MLRPQLGIKLLGTTCGTVDLNGGTSGGGLNVFGTSFFRWPLVSEVAFIFDNPDWKSGQFDLIAALHVWDERHHKAFLSWARAPWWQ